MIEKFKDSFLLELEKRLRNPFLGAFLISWVFWNWKLIYVLFFIDEKYVSLEPHGDTVTHFITKYEYLLSLGIANTYDSLLNPLWSSVFLVIFVEWVTTGAIIFIENIKNKILGYERLTKEASLSLKDTLKNERSNYLELQSFNNEEILSLQDRVSRYENSIDEKVSEKLRISQDKNIKRIKELETDLRKSEIVSSERLEKNLNLENSERNLRLTLESKSKEIEKLTQENQEFRDFLEKDTRSVDREHLSEYEEFKKSFMFTKFDQFIDKIESDSYQLHDIFSGKEIKFMEVKGIVEKSEDVNGYPYYRFTKKGDRFVEYFLDSYKGDLEVSSKKNLDKESKEEEIYIEDIPF